MTRSRVMQSVKQGELFSSESAIPETKRPRTSMFGAVEDSTGATQQQLTRLAGRLNASTASDEEYKDLLAERQHLVDKRLDGTITKKESIRLTYVRWSLDRIEDAKHGRSLDNLRARIEGIEKIGEQLEGLQKQLSHLAGKRPAGR